MPSQNLPKPNLPGQKPQDNSSQSNVAVPPSAAPNQSGPQSVFEQKPMQIRQTQVVPGGLSRENPGGTPPNMTVAAPKSSLEDSLKKPEPPKQQPLPSRPSGPLGQVTLSNDKPSAPVATVPTQVKDGVSSTPETPDKPQVTAPAQSPAPVPSAQATSPVTNSIAAAPASTSSTAAPVSAPQKSEKGGGILAKIKSLPKPVMIGAALLVAFLITSLLFSLFKPKTSTSSSSKTTTKSSSTNKSASNSANVSGDSTAPATTITYWGLWEDSQILKEVIADFESKNPTIKIDYRKQSHRDYRERLQQAIASGNGPDIFRYHVAWVPMLSADLSAMPSSIMTVAEYKQIFYPTAYNNLQVGGNIVGIPLMYDGLALFYNKEMLKTANIDVPTTWAELRTAANKLTVPANVSERQAGNITRAGLAIGNAGNVDHFSDILALLIIQNGGNPAEAGSQYVKDAITFYTNFIKQDKIWSDRLANSTTAFARGDVAMIFAPSWRAHDIKNLNPNLDFAVARVPQLDTQKPAAWATFWAEGVSAKSKSRDAAWSFLKYLSTPEVLRKFYNDASQYRAFGEIYPRTDMAAELQGNPLVASYVADAPLAKSWYMSSFTHDNGLNDQIIKYYEDAVNAVLSSTNVEKALETTVTGVNSVLAKYSSK